MPTIYAVIIHTSRLHVCASKSHAYHMCLHGAHVSDLQGYKHRNAYIATQAPLENTVGNFWCMIWEFSSRTVVMLCSMQDESEVRVIRWV